MLSEGIVNLIIDEGIACQPSAVEEIVAACPSMRAALIGKPFQEFCEIMIDKLGEDDFIFLNEFFEAINE